MKRKYHSQGLRILHHLPTAKLTRVLRDEVSMSGGTKYKSKFGKMEMYAVASSELTIALPGNRNAKTAA